ANGFVGMSEIVMGSEVVRRKRECCLIVGDRLDAAILSMRCRRTLAGKSEENPQPGIIRVRHQGVVQGLAIREVGLSVLRIAEVGQLRGANLDAWALGVTDVGYEALRLGECLIRCS